MTLVVTSLPQQALDVFIYQYSIDQNPGLAYLRTKLPCSSYMEAVDSANEIMALPYVLEKLANIIPGLPDRAQVTKDRAIIHLAAIAFADPSDFFEPVALKDLDGKEVVIDVIKDIHKMSPRARMAISKFDFNGAKREISTYDKLKAITLLSDMMGWKDENKDKKTQSEAYSDEELAELKRIAQDPSAMKGPSTITMVDKLN